MVKACLFYLRNSPPASFKLTRDVSIPYWMRIFKNYTSRIRRKTTTWVFQHNTSAKKTITGISYGAPAAIGANSVCADGVLMTMVIVSSTFIKI